MEVVCEVWYRIVPNKLKSNERMAYALLFYGKNRSRHPRSESQKALTRDHIEDFRRQRDFPVVDDTSERTT